MTMLAFLLAGWVRAYIPLALFNLEARPTIPSLPLLLLGIVPFWLLIFATQGLYRRRLLLSSSREYGSVFRATSIGMLGIIILGFIQPDSAPARGWVFLAWFFTTFFVILGRLVLHQVLCRFRRRGYFLSPTLIVGANAEAQSLAGQLSQADNSGLAVIGFVSDQAPPGSPVYKGLPVLGAPDELADLVRHFQVEELVLTSSALNQDEMLRIFKAFGMRSDVNLRLSSGLFEVLTTGMEVSEIAAVPLMRANQARLTGIDVVFKTILDLILALGLVILFAPVSLIIALAIRIDSPGPVIYRRRVIGLNGRSFEALKFRTMYVDGDAILEGNDQLSDELESTRKLKEDPRVTRLGRFLRKHSLDEIPQFYNVLRREMSVVGPRMITPEERVMYEQWDMNLLTVLPGITGLWQVSGRSDVSYGERVRLDMHYIRNWSLWLDIQILLRTVGVVINGRGAY